MTLHRRHFTAALAAGALPAWGQADEDAALRAAIAGPHRTPAYRARDAARHPYETLRFLGLAPRQTVVEAVPGGGWYTEILAAYLRDAGKLYLASEAADDADAYRSRSRKSLDERLARQPALYDRVVVGTLPRTPKATGFAPAGDVDMVLTFRNIHNWSEAGHLDATLAAFAAALKPGGVLGVVEHRAPAGSTAAWMHKNGYVTEDRMVECANAAGFELAARSEINANPRDLKDYPNGVWSLPPTLQGKDVERDRFVAIGESDRFTHRYVRRG